MEATYKTLTAEQLAMLDAPLPADAIKPHPTKAGLSTIKGIYVTERLNQVFGVGRWKVRTDFITRQDRTDNKRLGAMIVVKVVFSIPEYSIEYECFGGNDNADLGDAYKGATTDAIVKVASWLGIGADVYKDKNKPTSQPRPAKPTPTAAPSPAPKRTITAADLDDQLKVDSLIRWMASKYKTAAEARQGLTASYNIADAELIRILQLYESFRIATANAQKNE